MGEIVLRQSVRRGETANEEQHRAPCEREYQRVEQQVAEVDDNHCPGVCRERPGLRSEVVAIVAQEANRTGLLAKTSALARRGMIGQLLLHVRQSCARKIFAAR
jgi:hypothetical protein